MTMGSDTFETGDASAPAAPSLYISAEERIPELGELEPPLQPYSCGRSGSVRATAG